MVIYKTSPWLFFWLKFWSWLHTWSTQFVTYVLLLCTAFFIHRNCYKSLLQTWPITFSIGKLWSVVFSLSAHCAMGIMNRNIMKLLWCSCSYRVFFIIFLQLTFVIVSVTLNHFDIILIIYRCRRQACNKRAQPSTTTCTSAGENMENSAASLPTLDLRYIFWVAKSAIDLSSNSQILNSIFPRKWKLVTVRAQNDNNHRFGK